MPPKDTLGNRVRVVRERVGITQVDLAREVGISRQALISVEKGRMNPSVVVSLKIARILREPVDYLFFIDGRAGEVPEPADKAAKAAKSPKPTRHAAVPEPVAPAPTAVAIEPASEAPAPDEPHIVLDPNPEPEPEPYIDEEPPEAVIVDADEAVYEAPDPQAAPEPESSHARHAVPVSAEPEAPTSSKKPKESDDEADDAQLSLFE